MPRPRQLAIVSSVLALVACGDDEGSSSGASGASGPHGAGSTAELTAKEFNEAPIPDELEAVEDLAAANPGCAGVDARSEGFRQRVFIAAVQASAQTPMAEIVAEQCGADG